MMSQPFADALCSFPKALYLSLRVFASSKSQRQALCQTGNVTGRLSAPNAQSRQHFPARFSRFFCELLCGSGKDQRFFLAREIGPVNLPEDIGSDRDITALKLLNHLRAKRHYRVLILASS